MNEIEKKYVEFASKVSFFEFIQREFQQPLLDVKALGEEIEFLKNKKDWNVDKLSDYVKLYPKSFLIFQEIAQLMRFTNAQYIHFIFDVVKLNSLNLDAIFEYMIFNLKYDKNFRQTFLKEVDEKVTYELFISKINQYDKKYAIAKFKQSISKYIDKIIKNFSLLEQRIQTSEFADFSIRFSNYLLNNLQINEVLESIELEKFLIHKKIPVDTKSIHGNFAKIKILKILENSRFINIDPYLNKQKIKFLSHDTLRSMLPSNLQSSFLFCTEKYVDGVIKPKDKKPKKFDFIIFKDLQPKYLFEINFYSTEGTKISINQGEYIDLYNYIKNYHNELEFYWITDGNYWLSKPARERFNNLMNHFIAIYNINLFAEKIDDFK